MSQKTWDINGLSLKFDLDDAETAERYENAFAEMEKEELAIPKDGKLSAVIRAYHAMFCRLYDRLFGDGTAEQIFAGKPVSISACDEVYGSFLDFVRAQRAEIAEKHAERLTKYRPNRDQRRAAAKKPVKKSK